MGESDLLSGFIVLALVIFSAFYLFHCLHWADDMERRAEELRREIEEDRHGDL